jgi:hypothetical protein
VVLLVAKENIWLYKRGSNWRTREIRNLEHHGWFMLFTKYHEFDGLKEDVTGGEFSTQGS